MLITHEYDLFSPKMPILIGNIKDAPTGSPMT